MFFSRDITFFISFSAGGLKLRSIVNIPKAAIPNKPANRKNAGLLREIR